jgi:SAM-dependent methyltransferase
LPPIARLLVCAALVAQARPAAAQDPGTAHDAPFVPSPRSTVDEMLRLAAVGPADVVYDLGSGDGRVVIAAARKFGARAVGVEISAPLVARSRAAAERAGVADRVRFLEQDLFAADLGEATVITLYLSPNLNLKLRPALLALKAGTRIVSHGSDLGDWRPDRRTSIRKDVLLWFVPARVAGRWRSTLGRAPGERALELEFEQRFQDVSARARLGGAPAPVWEARLVADRLSFVIVDALDREDEAGLYFEGRVRGDRIEGGIARGAGLARTIETWRAERVR